MHMNTAPTHAAPYLTGGVIIMHMNTAPTHAVPDHPTETGTGPSVCTYPSPRCPLAAFPPGRAAPGHPCPPPPCWLRRIHGHVRIQCVSCRDDHAIYTHTPLDYTPCWTRCVRTQRVPCMDGGVSKRACFALYTYRPSLPRTMRSVYTRCI